MGQNEESKSPTQPPRRRRRENTMPTPLSLKTQPQTNAFTQHFKTFHLYQLFSHACSRHDCMYNLTCSQLQLLIILISRIIHHVDFLHTEKVLYADPWFLLSHCGSKKLASLANILLFRLCQVPRGSLPSIIESLYLNPWFSQYHQAQPVRISSAAKPAKSQKWLAVYHLCRWC